MFSQIGERPIAEFIADIAKDEYDGLGQTITIKRFVAQCTHRNMILNSESEVSYKPEQIMAAMGKAEQIIRNRYSLPFVARKRRTNSQDVGDYDAMPDVEKTNRIIGWLIPLAGRDNELLDEANKNDTVSAIKKLQKIADRTSLSLSAGYELSQNRLLNPEVIAAISTIESAIAPLQLEE